MRHRLRRQDLRAATESRGNSGESIGQAAGAPRRDHYLIHSYDFPPLATRGMPTANAMPQLRLRHLTRCTCRLISSRCLGCGRKHQGESGSTCVAKNMFMPWTSWSTRTFRERRMARPSAWWKRVPCSARQGPTAELTPTGGVFDHTAFAAIPARYNRTGRLGRRRGAGTTPSLPPPMRSPISRVPWARRARDVVARKRTSWNCSRSRILCSRRSKYWADQVEIQHRAAIAWVAHAEGKKQKR